MPAHDNLFCLLNAFLKKRRRDRAFIYVEEGDVIVGNFMEQDDELDEIRVRLLPERLLPPTEKVVQKRCDAEGEGVGVEVMCSGL